MSSGSPEGRSDLFDILLHLFDQCGRALEAPLLAHEFEVAEPKLFTVNAPVEVEDVGLDREVAAAERRLVADADDASMIRAIAMDGRSVDTRRRHEFFFGDVQIRGRKSKDVPAAVA